MTVIVDDATDVSAAVASTGMSEDLFAILVCPVDKQDLRLEQSTLVCVACNRSFPINDGIPDMLVEDQIAE